VSQFPDVKWPDQGEARRLLEVAADEVSRFYGTLTDRPIGPSWDDRQRRQWLQNHDFDVPRDLASVISGVSEALGCGNLLSAHPRCFGLFNPTPALAGAIADLLSASFNPQLAVTSHAPISVEIERKVIGEIAARIWPEASASGHFTSGGAEANMTALLLAATRAEPRYAEVGSRAFAGQPVFYASNESHFAWFKIAHQLGLGRNAVRLVATDGQGRMEVCELSQAIATDRNEGRIPIAIMATAGTTNAGMIDPLHEISSVTCIEGLWFHVDAAWAGGLLALGSKNTSLNGIELADSATIDAHKWFNAPMGAGMFLTRWPEALAETFHVSASYMPSGDGDDPYVRSAQWSRRHIGLRLFMILAAHGWNGVSSTIERQLQLGEQLRQCLREDDWRIENDSQCGVIVFNDDGGLPADAIVQAVQDEGDCWLSLARFEGRPVIRACVTSHLATGDDIQMLVNNLKRARSAAFGRH
jgi:aromatic-L-amino-acid decarboxylase